MKDLCVAFRSESLLLLLCLVGSIPAVASKQVVQTATLTASDEMSGDGFGSSLALSADTLIAGSPYSDGVGGAYVFINSDGIWTQVAKLTASDGSTGSQFGLAVAISGDTLAVGAPMQAGGAVYVFVKPTGGWANMTETAKLTNLGDVFGYSVAINGDQTAVIVGALFANAAYVFEKPAGGWANLESPTATLVTPPNSQVTGGALAAVGNTVVAGGDLGTSGPPNAAFVFILRPGLSAINSIATLTAADSGVLGYTVAIIKNTIVAGAQTRGNGVGGVFVFAKPETGWTDMTQTAELTTNLKGQPAFGAAVAISDQTVVAGAPSARLSGVAVAYIRPASGWASSSSPNYWATSPDPSNHFGEAIAFEGGTTAIGCLDQGQNALCIFSKP